MKKQSNKNSYDKGFHKRNSAMLKAIRKIIKDLQDLEKSLNKGLKIND